ncbi:MAG: lipopolysaccharide biosynthesis protein, partial [Fervidobacterium pennivorans]
LFTYSFPLVFEFVASYIMVFTDRFMLRLLTNFNEIGMYSAAYKLISISGILTSGFLYFWRPYALSLFNEDPERTRNVTRKMFDTVTAGIVLFALSLIAIRDVVAILLGSEYREAKYIFPFLLFAPIYDLSKAVLIRGVEFSKKSKWAAVPNFIGAFVNVIGNWLLIPILGARGAAISTALSMLVVIIFLSFISNKLYPVQYNFLKVYTAYFVYIFAAAFGTFVEYSYSLIISIISIIVILLLFKKQVTEIISELSEYVRELFLRFHS